MIKCIRLFIQCSGIEEYRTKEIVENPKDYDIDLNKLILMMNICYYGRQPSYHLYLFDDGKIFTGEIQTMELFWQQYDAIERSDADAMVDNAEMIYLGNMSGEELYKIMQFKGKINYSADDYDYVSEYYRLFEMIEDPREPSDFKTFEVDPWITADCFENGKVNSIYTQASDGIRYYLYDKHANEMLHIIEDSWYFDQWMTEIYGEDWSNKITIYRSEKDIVRP
ncbi:MAG: hypothetical protein K6C99_05910 [Lachnospiraceae bacterium]|nr:hypothetical protein [Lachnospiraceae bacterium]